MGNRGGRIHKPDRTLQRRRFASKRWICCVCDFRGRQRRVWADSYTELFFLDEVTALAAGHRPCFECRRAEARSFSAHFGGCTSSSADAGTMDTVLHRERLAGWEGQYVLAAPDTLPDGAMFAQDDQAFAVRDGRRLVWSFAGYGDAGPVDDRVASVLTPASIVRTLQSGYQPRWHASALQLPEPPKS